MVRAFKNAAMKAYAAPWVVAMDWHAAAFFHWPVTVDLLRPHIPPSLTIDTYAGQAWIGVVAFRIEHARFRGFPSFVGWRDFGEINVRTYVREGERSGVWFLSLDAAHAGAVGLGRKFLHLPYYHAAVDVREGESDVTYRSRRFEVQDGEAMFEAIVSPEGASFTAEAGSMEYWFAERYAFYTVDRGGRVLRGDVAHQPWPLQLATARISHDTLVNFEDPVVTHWSRGVETRAFPLVRSDSRSATK